MRTIGSRTADRPESPSSAAVTAALACAPSLAEPVSSRTDSGSSPGGDARGGGLDQQRALPRAGPTEQAHGAAQTGLGQHGGRQCGAWRGHGRNDTTGVRQVTRRAGWQHRRRDLSAARIPLRPGRACPGPARPRPDGVRQALGASLAAHLPEVEHAGPRPARPRPVVVGRAVDDRRQRRRAGRADRRRGRRARWWWWATPSAARSR